MATVKRCCENCCSRGGKKKFVFRRGREERSARKRAECWSWREQFHAAELIRGGERSWVWAAVSRSMTFIGPPHLGQRYRSRASSVEEVCSSLSASCAAPNNSKHRGNVAERRRQARKPKCRIRTKPCGSRCSRKRRKNLSCDKAVSFCSLW